jgi:hypothetical protein
MNYDLDTEEGLANAIEWTNNVLDHLKEGGVWYVPRSCSTVQVVSHERKEIKCASLLPDPSLHRVLREAGWTNIK